MPTPRIPVLLLVCAGPLFAAPRASAPAPPYFSGLWHVDDQASGSPAAGFLQRPVFRRVDRACCNAWRRASAARIY